MVRTPRPRLNELPFKLRSLLETPNGMSANSIVASGSAQVSERQARRYPTDLCVRRQLARWRQTRPHPRAPIPAAVWAAAVVLARQHGVYPMARALPIDFGALKAHVARADGLTEVAGPPTFVETRCRDDASGARVCHRVRRPGRHAPSAGPWPALAEFVALTRALGGREA